MKTKNIIILTAVAVVFLLNGCKKKADVPPLHSPFNKTYSVPELKAIASCTGNCSMRFTEDVFFAGVVIADQVSGNMYKELYIRDRYNTGAIRLDFKSSPYYTFIGDSVRLSLKGYDVTYNQSTGMLEIDSVDYEKHFTKYGSGATPQPVDIELGCVNYNDYLCELVRISDVGFIPADANQSYADVIGQASLNRVLQHGGGAQVEVRTSNYAVFANEKTPTGCGSIVGIATAYAGTNQLALRKTSEVNMNGSPFTIYHAKDWNDNSLTSGGWSQQSVTDPGTVWSASTFGTDEFAKISGYYSGTNHNSENWLISPVINLSGASNPMLSFRTAAKFSGNKLEVMVSTNYTSGAPSTATWTSMSGFNLSPNTGNYEWTGSCKISLKSFKNSNTRIAFKYTSSTSASTTYELDDVTVWEK